MYKRLPPLPSIREILQMYNLRATKDLSQNFLLDKRITDKIAMGFPQTKPHKAIIEVGCGPGCLTRSLLETCVSEKDRLFGIEKDDRFLPALQMLQQASNEDHEIFRLIQGDALQIHEQDIFGAFPVKKYDFLLAGNLPFNVATPLFLKWLRLHYNHQTPPFSMLLMFQKEVAERIAAKQGSSEYGRLSILSQYLFDAKILFDVKGNSFIPPPKVDASVILLRPNTVALEKSNELKFETLESFVQMIFGTRRKQIYQTLKNRFEKQTIEHVFDKFLQIHPSKEKQSIALQLERRAQEFDVKEIITLATLFSQQQQIIPPATDKEQKRAKTKPTE